MEEMPCVSLMPGLGRSPGGGNGNQYSWRGNLMNRGAWWATVHGVTKSQIGLSGWAWCAVLPDKGTLLMRLNSGSQGKQLSWIIWMVPCNHKGSLQETGRRVRVRDTRWYSAGFEEGGQGQELRNTGNLWSWKRQGFSHTASRSFYVYGNLFKLPTGNKFIHTTAPKPDRTLPAPCLLHWQLQIPKTGPVTKLCPALCTQGLQHASLPCPSPSPGVC